MRAFLKHNLLWASLVAVLVPLSVLGILQYRWLAELEEKSAIAHAATLHNYLEGVTHEIEYFYRSAAERHLNLPSSIFIRNRLNKAAQYFAKKKPKGIKELFVVSYVGHDARKLLFFDRWFDSMETPSSKDVARAAYIATSQFEALAKAETGVDSVQLTVDERDLDNRIILNPILDEQSRVVGVAGMILDLSFFRDKLLREVILVSMKEFFSDDAGRDLIVRVRDGRGTLLPGSEKTGEEVEEGMDEYKEEVKPLTFVFTDHRLELSSRYKTPEMWARTGFILNISLSVILALFLLGVIILALRTASREMKLSEMKNDFVSNVSHELRTPLASIRVFGEFLRLGRVDSDLKVREYGEFIETESRRLTGLVNNILDFSRIESGRKTYKFKKTNINDVLEHTLKTFDVTLKQSGFTIKRENIERFPPIKIDGEAIGQAVSNLVDNAVKYSKESKEIEVRLERQNGWAVISIRDHGIGISGDEQEKIFERFHRVGTGLVHDVKGSGLGLSIVSHIVHAHQGAVDVESSPDRGSTFSIKLPIDLEISYA